MAESVQRGRCLTTDALLTHFYGAWYPAHNIAIHSEDREVEVLWDGEVTRSLLPVSDGRHFHSVIVRENDEIDDALHRLKIMILAYVQRVYRVFVNCSPLCSNRVDGQAKPVERGKFSAADAVLIHFCGAWYPAHVLAVHSEGREIEVLWDGEFTHSVLPVYDVLHFYSDTVHDTDEIDNVLQNLMIQVLAYVQRGCRVLISCSPCSSKRLDGDIRVGSDEKSAITDNFQEGPSGTKVHEQIADKSPTEQSDTVGMANARSASSTAQPPYVETPPLSTQSTQVAQLSLAETHAAALE